jgi:hypothetical protein
MPNKRVYYAVHCVGLAQEGGTVYQAAYGVQQFGHNTNFEITQIYELGKLAVYANIEGVPEVEVTIEKVLDGHPLLFHLATSGAPEGSLAGRQNKRCNLINNVYVDTQLSATGTPIAQVEMSGLYFSALSYTFDTQGAFTESVTLVGNNKRWILDLENSGTPRTINGSITPTHAPLAVEGVNMRQHFNRSTSRFPKQIAGVNQSTGTINDFEADGTTYKVHPQRVAISTSLGREGIYELGRKGPYFRFAGFPTEVTCEIAVLTTSGDEISCYENAASNTSDETILVETTEGTKISLGSLCRLRSVQTSGGDAGQSNNVTATYRYTTYNDMLIQHPADVTLALRP